MATLSTSDTGGMHPTGTRFASAPRGVDQPSHQDGGSLSRDNLTSCRRPSLKYVTRIVRRRAAERTDRTQTSRF
jgi:hypothetical protein